MKTRLDFWSNDYVGRSLTRARTWNLAAGVMANRHPNEVRTIRLFRELMRTNALDAVRLAKEFSK